MAVSPRKVDKPLVLYGYGKLGRLAEEIFNELKIKITLIMDKAGIEIITSPFLKRNALVAICVASEPYAQVIAPLVAAGWTDILPVWDILEYYADRTGIHNGWFAGDISSDDFSEMLYVRAKFPTEDHASRFHYKIFCEWRKERGIEAATPDSPPSLPSTLADIRARQTPDKCIYYHYENPKDIMIHAEGRELEHLEKMLPHYVKFRPKLRVSCYHSRDGLWRIERFLMDNLPDYTWTFRLHAYMGQAAYIYGMPKERL